MTDYEPLDISRWCNAGLAELGEGQEGATGRCAFRGLPFLVGVEEGDTEGKCLIGLDDSSGSVVIPIRKHARWVVFAHRRM